MLIAVDIGNTNITLGIFDGDVLKETFRMESDMNTSEKDYTFLIKKLTSKYDINKCIIASVVDELTPIIQKVCEDLFKTKSLIVSANIKLPFTMHNVAKSEEIGADRIVNAAYAVLKHKQPVIIVDFGTATTLEIINSEKDFIGGVIMPGLKMQMKSLYQNTSKLPNIEIADSENVMGLNTRDCMLSGVIRGTAYAIDGFIKNIEAELGEKPFLVATGGYCELVTKYMDCKHIEVRRSLTLEGLRLLYELNSSRCAVSYNM